MDLLDEKCTLDLFDHAWRVYSVNPNRPPQYISSEATVVESLINEGCTIEGDIERTVVFQGVTVGKGSKIKGSVLMPDSVVGRNTVIENCIVPSDTVIPDGSVIRAANGEIILINEEMFQEKQLETQ